MTRSNNLPGSVASLTEKRLTAALKIAELKREIDKYQQLETLASESCVFRTEMRLTAAIKIAALKIEVDRYLELGKSATELSDIEATENVTPVPTPRLPVDNNEHHQSALKRDVKKTCQTKISESDWVNKQARKLLGDRDMKKKVTIK